MKIIRFVLLSLPISCNSIAQTIETKLDGIERKLEEIVKTYAVRKTEKT